MNAVELLERIEAAGGVLTLKHGGRIAYDVPEESAPKPSSQANRYET